MESLRASSRRWRSRSCPSSRSAPNSPPARVRAMDRWRIGATFTGRTLAASARAESITQPVHACGVRSVPCRLPIQALKAGPAHPSKATTDARRAVPFVGLTFPCGCNLGLALDGEKPAGAPRRGSLPKRNGARPALRDAGRTCCWRRIPLPCIRVRPICDVVRTPVATPCRFTYQSITGIRESFLRNDRGRCSNESGVGRLGRPAWKRRKPHDPWRLRANELKAT